jgi:hypothetical protein
MPLPLLTVLLYCVKTDESECEQAYSDSASVKKERKKNKKRTRARLHDLFSICECTFASVP